MKKAVLFAIALGPYLLAPAAASAAENLDCVETGYTAEMMGDFEARKARYSFQQGVSPDLPAEQMTAIAERAGQCAELHGWSPLAIEDALFYRTFDLMRQLLLSGTPLTSAQMTRIDQAIASTDQVQLRRVIARMVDASMEGQESPDPSQADNMLLGRMALRAGIPLSESNSEYFGAYMASVVAPQIYAQRFATR